MAMPLPSTPIIPSFSSFINTTAATATTTTGRGKATAAEPPLPHQLGHRKPIFFTKDEQDEQLTDSATPKPSQDTNLPSSILSVLSLSGAGRGIQIPLPNDKRTQENRQLKSRQPPPKGESCRWFRIHIHRKQDHRNLSHDEAVMKAVGILSRGGGSSNVRAEEGGRVRGILEGEGAAVAEEEEEEKAHYKTWMMTPTEPAFTLVTMLMVRNWLRGLAPII
ncbi:hypothetical protein Acr_00g0047090 [Actinidia rufa]|uniref:Uncharacterized protein n=1 Tax=Actinidia rufa TaxID=165716 RepID=A0A7J0DJM6_9ERIC|nr:hypothetical protein Acr_00g0047090 [Actinidia rufa]